jgi:hypothetical protein
MGSCTQQFDLSCRLTALSPSAERYVAASPTHDKHPRTEQALQDHVAVSGILIEFSQASEHTGKMEGVWKAEVRRKTKLRLWDTVRCEEATIEKTGCPCPSK